MSFILHSVSNQRPGRPTLIGLSLWLQLCLLLPVFGYAQDQQLRLPTAAIDAYAIAEQVYFVDHFYAFDNLLVGYKSAPDMLLLSHSGKSVSMMKTERYITHQPKQEKLKTQDLVIFKSGKLRGTGILVDDFKQLQPMQIRMWLPALRKIRRFSEPELDDIWGGSHLTYGDLYLRRPEHETHELVASDELPTCLEDAASFNDWTGKRLKQTLQPWCELNPNRLTLLKSTPREPSPWYDYRLRLIDQQTFAEYQVEYFKGGELVKRTQKNWHAAGLDDPRAQIWNFWTVKLFANGQITGESIAWIDEDSQQWNQPVSDRLWSERSLRQIRR
ncbi:MAG: outer membrane lipoprotein-sorting protein [Gammaproteobacteria bacterium]|nr:outer membrane lipoprotein-sorting protein [Gammaproteobacteria bacterium]